MSRGALKAPVTVINATRHRAVADAECGSMDKATTFGLIKQFLNGLKWE